MIMLACGQTQREVGGAVYYQQREDNSTKSYETDAWSLCLSQFFSLITHCEGLGAGGGKEREGERDLNK